MSEETTPHQPPAPARTLGKIAGALAKAQAVMTGAKKDAKNSHFRNSYATLEAVIGAVREPLSSNGVAFFQWFETDGTKVTNYTMLIHAESGEYLESGPASAESKGKGPQEIGSTVTYLRRYQLMAMCGIAPEDDDGEAAHGRQPEQAQPRPQAQQSNKQQPAEQQPTAQGPKPAATTKPDEAAELRKHLTDLIKREGFDPGAIKAWCENRGYPDSSAKLNAEQLTELIEYLTKKESA